MLLRNVTRFEHLLDGKMAAEECHFEVATMDRMQRCLQHAPAALRPMADGILFTHDTIVAYGGFEKRYVFSIFWFLRIRRNH